MKCKHCGKDIEQQGPPLKEWIHKDGFYNCDGRRGHSDTYAEPTEPVEAK